MVTKKSSFQLCFKMSLLLAFVLGLSSTNAFGMNRVKNRRSTFCTSLLVATKAMARFGEASASFAKLTQFRKKTLGCYVNFQDQTANAVCANPTADPQTIKKLAERVYDVERSFQKISTDEQFVIGQTQVVGEDSIQQFMNLLNNSRAEVAKLAEADYRKLKFSPRGFIETLTKIFFYNWSPTFVGLATGLDFLLGYFLIRIATGQVQPERLLEFTNGASPFL